MFEPVLQECVYVCVCVLQPAARWHTAEWVIEGVKDRECKRLSLLPLSERLRSLELKIHLRSVNFKLENIQYWWWSSPFGVTWSCGWKLGILCWPNALMIFVQLWNCPSSLVTSVKKVKTGQSRNGRLSCAREVLYTVSLWWKGLATLHHVESAELQYGK